MYAVPRCPLDRGIEIKRLQPVFRLHSCQGKIPAYLDCRVNLIDVRDVAEGLVRAMQRGRPGVRYLLGGHNYRLIEWLQVLGQIVNRPAPQWTIPYPVALAIGWFNELWADHISHRMPMATVTGVRLTKRTMHFDPSETFAELGLKPRPIAESATDAGALVPRAALDLNQRNRGLRKLIPR